MNPRINHFFWMPTRIDPDVLLAAVIEAIADGLANRDAAVIS
jgi:hypothetical protein